MPLPPAPSAAWSYYVDFDGTLTPIVDRPDAVVVGPDVIDLLGRLHRRTGGALAIVTGRPIAAIDRLLTPLRLTIAGLHGLETRLGDGAIRRLPASEPALTVVRTAFQAAVAEDPRLLLEDKGPTLALHYRAAPDQAVRVTRLAETLADAVAGALVPLHGKAVVEFRPTGTDKGRAIVGFQAAAPFAGRRPVFLGDDTTDEDGFRAVSALDGIAIRVGGHGPSAAPYALPDVAAVVSWLALVEPTGFGAVP